MKRTSRPNSPFLEIEKSLDPDFCCSLINKFEKDTRKSPGKTGNGVNEDLKKSVDLYISDLEEYKEEDKVLFESLAKGLEKYRFEKLLPIDYDFFEVNDSGYQIQRTDPDGYYNWHHDFICQDVKLPYMRVLTFIWYLNTVKEGETEFAFHGKVKPEQGKLLLFPASWDNIHRGLPPRSTKYICTGWVYDKMLISVQ